MSYQVQVSPVESEVERSDVQTLPTMVPEESEEPEPSVIPPPQAQHSLEAVKSPSSTYPHVDGYVSYQLEQVSPNLS